MTANQSLFAAVIVSVGKALKQTPTQIQEALMAAATESGFQNYANKYNPASLAIQHDKVGSDHGSVGLFQQQVGGAPHSTANWGTTAELMNPVIAAQKFFQALDAKGQHGDMASTVQNVQGSVHGDGSNYRVNQQRAADIYSADAGVTANPAELILGSALPVTPNAMDKIGNGITGVVTSPINAVKDGLKGIDAIASLAEQGAGAIVSEAFWIRVGFGVMGFVLLIAGIDMLARGGTAPSEPEQAAVATQPSSNSSSRRRSRAIGKREPTNEDASHGAKSDAAAAAKSGAEAA